MTNLLNTFIKFLEDREAADMYITGVAGTGKTTSLAELVKYCSDNKIEYVVSAYTHKACHVLRNKLHKEAEICTLHSFLSKRPTINDKALEVQNVEGNSQTGKPKPVKVLFIDEFSMVGDKDYTCISDLQYNEDGDIVTQVVYIGDPNQLPPVRDIAVIQPKGDYWVKLTQVYRQAGDNPLIDNLLAINEYINGEEPQALVEHDNLIRGVDIVKEYNKCSNNKIILAYTNARVEELNANIQGRVTPLIGDTLFTPTIRKEGSLLAIEDKSDGIIKINGSLLELNSKYKTLEALHELQQIKFYTLSTNDGEIPIAAVFGHNSFLLAQQELANEAVKINKQIQNEFKQDPKEWSKNNYEAPLARKRARAWAKYLAFKDCVYCLDFNHAMTVHKSQGSTYNTVFIDTEDLSKCANKDYTMYLKLLYVAISRASSTVYTN